ncbi:hypothetical protein JUJ52_22845 [Virgibacillus sp. AGTR]|uniref:hypothetical protein n=1 Tax=unclassified Virgibacillus TaxID=2620237 RepID=UPI000EF453F0|nr:MULTISPECIES: hypothetical protein [unclassified Virgibacillus]MCC2252762.1 hypothetical protein [Virgibacillus sp. AGTR]
MKKIFILAVAFFALFLVVQPAFAEQREGQVSSDKTSELSQSDIEQKLLEIDSKYDVGDMLSKEDSQFIEEYGSVPEQVGSIQLFRTKKISGSGKNGKHKASLSGSISASTGLTYGKFSGNFTTKVTSSKTPSSIKNTLSHTAYGYNGGINVLHKVYNKTLSKTCKKKKSCNFNNGDRYSGAVAYHTTISKAFIKFSDGKDIVIMP